MNTDDNRDMASLRTTLPSVAAALVAIAAFPGHASAQAQPPSEVRIAGPVAYASHAVPTLGEEIHVSVEGFTLARRVYLSYSLNLPATPTSSPDLFDSQIFATDYWPTAICWLDPSTLCVAGRDYQGTETIIEVWRFNAPQYRPGGQTPGGASKTPKLIAGSRESVNRIYDATDPTVNMIQGLMPLFGANDTVLALTYGGKDLYALDTTSGTLQLVASPVSSPSVIHEPALSSFAWESYQSRRHVSEGYVYVLHAAGDEVGGLDPSTPSILFFVDSDMDGEIDMSVMLSEEDWQAGEYQLPSSWIP